MAKFTKDEIAVDTLSDRLQAMSLSRQKAVGLVFNIFQKAFCQTSFSYIYLESYANFE